MCLVLTIHAHVKKSAFLLWNPKKALKWFWRETLFCLPKQEDPPGIYYFQFKNVLQGKKKQSHTEKRLLLSKIETRMVNRQHKLPTFYIETLKRTRWLPTWKFGTYQHHLFFSLPLLLIIHLCFFFCLFSFIIFSFSFSLTAYIFKQVLICTRSFSI